MTALTMVLLAVIFGLSQAFRPLLPPPPATRLSGSRLAFLRAGSGHIIEWRTDPVEAIAESRRTGMPLLIFVGSSGSAEAAAVESRVFESDLASRIQNRFIALRVDGDESPHWQQAALPLSAGGEPLGSSYILSVWNPRRRLMSARLDAAGRGPLGESEARALLDSAFDSEGLLAEEQARQAAVMSAPADPEAPEPDFAIFADRPGLPPLRRSPFGAARAGYWEARILDGEIEEVEAEAAEAVGSGLLAAGGLTVEGWRPDAPLPAVLQSRMAESAPLAAMLARTAARTGRESWRAAARTMAQALAEPEGAFWRRSPAGELSPDHAARGSAMSAAALIECGLWLGEQGLARAGLRRLGSLWSGRLPSQSLTEALVWGEAAAWAYAATGSPVWRNRVARMADEALSVGFAEGIWWSAKPLRAADRGLPIQIRAMDGWEESDAARLVRFLARASAALERPSLLELARSEARRIGAWIPADPAPAWGSFARAARSLFEGGVVALPPGDPDPGRVLRSRPLALVAWGPPPGDSNRS